MSTWSATRRVASPPAPTWASRFNDHSLEILIATWRILALAAMAGWAVVGVAAAFAPGDLLLPALALWIAALLFGYLGFWLFGNSSWRADDDRA